MNRARGQTIGDVLGIAAAALFLLADSFAGMRNQVTETLALLVAGLSLWRIYRRHRGPR